MPPWFPGDPGSPGGPGVGGLATQRRETYPDVPVDYATEAQEGDAEYLPHRRLTVLSGHVFPAAVQPIGPVTGRFYGDAGDGEQRIAQNGLRPEDAGRDLVADGGPRAQWSAPLWGMNDAATEYRTRYLVALDAPSAAGRPQFAPRSMAMRPSATAVPVRAFGEPAGVQTRRVVAPGRVTRWEQPNLVWPEFGTRGGG